MGVNEGKSLNRPLRINLAPHPNDRNIGHHHSQSHALLHYSEPSTSMSDTDDLRSLLKRIMTFNEHSDITISCGAYNYRVHRVIISAQSEVLAAMCNANFLVRTTRNFTIQYN